MFNYFMKSKIETETKGSNSKIIRGGAVRF